MEVAYNADGIGEDGNYDETKDRRVWIILKEEYPETYEALVKMKKEYDEKFRIKDEESS